MSRLAALNGGIGLLLVSGATACGDAPCTSCDESSDGVLVDASSDADEEDTNGGDDVGLDLPGDGDGGFGCFGSPAPIDAIYSLPGLDDTLGSVIDESCTVESVDFVNTETTVVFDCPDVGAPLTPMVELVFTVVPPPDLDLEAGEAVRLRAVSDGPSWINKCVRVDDASGDWVLGAAEADDVRCDDLDPWPWTIEWDSSLCDTRDTGCGPNATLALQLDPGGLDRQVFGDSYTKDVGPAETMFSIWVGRATRFADPPTCPNTPRLQAEIFARRRP